MTFEAKHTNSDFYPRPPRGGRPLAVKNSCVHEAISIHALREEGDKDNSASFLPGEGFLSTPSARRATCGRYQVRQRHFEFLSTPSARRATVQFAVIKSWGKIFLSTPSARRATILACGAALAVQISIHALREEGDATRMAARARLANFYPRPPRGGRLPLLRCQTQPAYISIHALREEGDQGAAAASEDGTISIHALREEGDCRERPIHCVVQ